MTIREWIIKGTLNAASYRLEKLKEIGAPEVMIEGQSKMVDNLKNGIIKIGGDTEILDEEYIGCEKKTGRGGKTYFIINNEVNFFPAAKYGLYIKRANKG